MLCWLVRAGICYYVLSCQLHSLPPWYFIICLCAVYKE